MNSRRNTPVASQINTAQAFFVVHHCPSSALNSSPSSACGSSSAFLHPFAPKAVSRQLEASSSSHCMCKQGIAIDSSPLAVQMMALMRINRLPNACRMSTTRACDKN
jgi:predicted ArsR family transcriptional regulator